MGELTRTCAIVPKLSSLPKVWVLLPEEGFNVDFIVVDWLPSLRAGECETRCLVLGFGKRHTVECIVWVHWRLPSCGDSACQGSQRCKVVL